MHMSKINASATHAVIDCNNGIQLMTGTEAQCHQYADDPDTGRVQVGLVIVNLDNTLCLRGRKAF